MQKLYDFFKDWIRKVQINFLAFQVLPKSPGRLQPVSAPFDWDFEKLCVGEGLLLKRFSSGVWYNQTHLERFLWKLLWKVVWARLKAGILLRACWDALSRGFLNARTVGMRRGVYLKRPFRLTVDSTLTKVFSSGWDVSFSRNFNIQSGLEALLSGLTAPCVLWVTQIFFFGCVHVWHGGSLAPPPGIKPTPTALGSWSLNPWTPREKLTSGLTAPRHRHTVWS